MVAIPGLGPGAKAGAQPAPNDPEPPRLGLPNGGPGRAPSPSGEAGSCKGGQRKDVEDLKRLLRLPLDLSYLKKRALQAGLDKELQKIWRRVHGTRL